MRRRSRLQLRRVKKSDQLIYIIMCLHFLCIDVFVCHLFWLGLGVRFGIMSMSLIRYRSEYNNLLILRLIK